MTKLEGVEKKRTIAHDNKLINASIRYRFALQTHLRKPGLLAFHFLLFHLLHPSARFHLAEVGDQEDGYGFEEGGEDVRRGGDIGDVIICGLRTR